MRSCVSGYPALFFPFFFFDGKRPGMEHERPVRSVASATSPVRRSILLFPFPYSWSAIGRSSTRETIWSCAVRVVFRLLLPSLPPRRRSVDLQEPGNPVRLFSPFSLGAGSRRKGPAKEKVGAPNLEALSAARAFLSQVIADGGKTAEKSLSFFLFFEPMRDGH